MRNFVFFFCIILSAKASVGVIKIRALGASPKGQYVAFEEFGYLDGEKTPFSTIRVKNVWKNRYVEGPIKVVSEDGQMKLEQVRAKAKKLAKERLAKFYISQT